MDDKKWMNDISRKMEGFEMSPPEHLWEGIERQVNIDFAEHKTVMLHTHRTWMAAAIMTGLLVMGGGVWFIMHQEEDSVFPSTGPHPTIAKIVPPSHTSSQVEERSLAKEENAYFAQNGYARSDIKGVGMQSDSSYNHVEKPDTCQNETVGNVQSQQSQLGQPSQSRPNYPRRKNHIYDTSSLNNTLLASRHSEEDRFSVSLTAAGFMSSDSQQGGYGELLAGSIWLESSADGVKGDNDPVDDFGSLEEVIVGNNNKEVYTTKKHRQPVKVGVSVNYRLDDRWAIGTGVTYSYLSSDLMSGTDDSHYTTYQKLQYVGIPLNVNYTFYQHQKWSVYGTTGGMVEKCVRGKSTTEFTVGGKQQAVQYDDVKEKRLQYSVGVALGVQAKIADHVGFYLEPGVSYHFDNRSNVTNIYKDTPLNFSLGLGFRYSF